MGDRVAVEVEDAPLVGDMEHDRLMEAETDAEVLVLALLLAEHETEMLPEGDIDADNVLEREKVIVWVWDVEADTVIVTVAVTDAESEPVADEVGENVGDGD